MSGDHYETLGVARDASADDVRSAYRAAARANHPDAHGAPTDAHRTMARLNAAWYVLSDTERRSAYDESQRSPTGRSAPPTDQPGEAARTARAVPGARREAWLEGMRTQMLRLGNQAGRSATMNLSLPTGRDRPRYAALLEPIIEHLAQDTAPRIRQARALGAQPLDLGVVAALVGLRSYAVILGRQIRRAIAEEALNEEISMQAALLDRMWDVMAHEVPHDIAMELGGNPRLARTLAPSGSKRSRRRGRNR